MDAAVTKLCWICRLRPADSREHKFKVADQKRLFTWDGDDAPVHGIGGQEPITVHSPEQHSLTFGLVICDHCNSAASQPWDRAYDRFIDWLLRNRAAILKTRVIDFVVVFGGGWERSQLNLFRYFAKHLGCNIASA